MRATLATVAAVTALVLAGCASSDGGSDPTITNTSDPAAVDQAANDACLVFGRGYGDADDAESRDRLARDVIAAADGTVTNEVIANAAGLGRTANGNDAAWKLAADSFAAACERAGYKAP